MASLVFRGGVHPEYRKELTASLAVVSMPAPAQVVIPLQQHIGAPCEPLVQVGDQVKLGQKIGDSKGFVSAPVHASVSGKVAAIGPYNHPLGRPVQSITIESDGLDTWDQSIKPAGELHELSRDEIRKLVREAGIVGMGGATFPAHVKLAPPPEKPIDTVIINGAECEPYLTADHRLMLESPDIILGGLRLFQKILGVKDCYIGIEENKPDAIELMRERTRGQDDVKVVGLHVRYPQGAEKQLIKAITGREVPPGGLPMDVGAVVQNVGTAHAAFEAIARGIPLIERAATITGDGIKQPRNLRIRIGTPLEFLIEQCGGLVDSRVKVIMGGPMMGIAQHNLSAPSIKGTSGMLVFPLGEIYLEEQGPCIRCARCVDVCPMNITPCHIATACEFENFEEAQVFGLMDCIECGCCVYVCPTRRHLVHFIKYGKSIVIARKKVEQAKAR